MTFSSEDAKLLCEYEQKFFDMIVKTYDMLEQLDEARDEEFWRVFDLIEAAYFEIKTAEKNYFEILTREGGTANGCSLHHELEHGLYCLDEKYAAIEDKVKRFSLKTL
jgi:hypothetical protein